jgi:hypothetical protein
VDRTDRWRRSKTVLWRFVLDDAVLLCPGRAEPFALAGGARLWTLLDEPLRIDELLAALSAEQESNSEKDLARLLGDLAEAGAVERLPG